MKISLWIGATRPKTLAASISPIAIGTAIALKDGFFDLLTFCFILLTGLGVQISTNIANDWLDGVKGSDRVTRIGPRRLTQSGLVSPSHMKRATLVVMGLTALCGLFLIWKGGIVIAGLLAFALVLALAYTGGPFPLAYLGISEFFILIFLGPVATASTYYLLTGHFTSESLLAGFGPGLISCAILSINNLRDEQEDRISNKKTPIVRFGSMFGKMEYTLTILLACLLPLLFMQTHPFVPFASLILIPALPLIVEVFKIQNPAFYIPLLGKTGRLLLLYTFIFCCSYML